MIALDALLLLPALAADPAVDLKAPDWIVKGLPYVVTVELRPVEGPAQVPLWALTPAAFELGGKPLAPRAEAGAFELRSSATLQLDLEPYISAAPDFGSKTLELGYAFRKEGGPIAVTNQGEIAEKGLDFMEMPVEQLGNYLVLLQTNRGSMVCEFWPEDAPGHVRNFLDLAYTGFYDGTTFHRVIPGFMIQGGDPTGTGSGNGKRMLKSEFNKRKHVPGVLSMARTNDPNSASCQFFVMHGNATNLDGQYSAFGQLVSGLDVVDKIVKTPRGGNDRPNEKQVIERAVVLKRPAN